MSQSRSPSTALSTSGDASLIGAAQQAHRERELRLIAEAARQRDRNDLQRLQAAHAEVRRTVLRTQNCSRRTL